MGAIKKGRYPGKANSAFGVKWFYKPALGKVVGRTPGVNRKSDNVLARNKHMRELKPAAACKGKDGKSRDWASFVACLSEKMSS